MASLGLRNPREPVSAVHTVELAALLPEDPADSFQLGLSFFTSKIKALGRKLEKKRKPNDALAPQDWQPLRAVRYLSGTHFVWHVAGAVTTSPNAAELVRAFGRGIRSKETQASRVSRTSSRGSLGGFLALSCVCSLEKQGYQEKHDQCLPPISSFRGTGKRGCSLSSEWLGAGSDPETIRLIAPLKINPRDCEQLKRLLP